MSNATRTVWLRGRKPQAPGTWRARTIYRLDEVHITRLEIQLCWYPIVPISTCYITIEVLGFSNYRSSDLPPVPSVRVFDVDITG